MARLLVTVNGFIDSYALPLLSPVVLRLVNGFPVVELLAKEQETEGTVLAPVAERGHVLFAGPGLEEPADGALIAGTCRLLDGDRIRIGEQIFEYSTTDWIDPARIEHYTGGGRCLLRKDPLVPGDEAVLCPKCGIAMHAQCLDDTVQSCPLCGCPVAHDHEEALTLSERSREAW